MTIPLGTWIYATGKLNVSCWRCSVTASTLCIESKKGVDGKIVTRIEHISIGKQGRSAVEQAEFEAASRYKKKIDKGYSGTIPLKDSVKTNALGYPMPQLAKSYNAKLDLEKVVWYFQPKLDGHRAIIRVENNEAVMYSRGGKLITSMGHILERILAVVKDALPINLPKKDVFYFDGELYIHGKSLQDITSLIKREQQGSVQVKFWAYDFFADAFEASNNLRLDILTVLLGSEEETSPIVLTPTVGLNDLGEHNVRLMTVQAELKGFEGGILRDSRALYTPGFRSKGLLKVKSFEDSEYPILEVIEGKDRVTPAATLKVACFILETPSGKRFEVTSPGTMHEKDHHWHNRSTLIGKLVTVKHKGFTKLGIPWHPVALRMRDDI